MKITTRDLESSINEKLNQFDNIVENYSEANSDGFISYSKEKGFYFKKTNDTYLRKVYSEDELIEMKNGIKSPKENMISSYYDDLRNDKSVFNAAFSNIIYDANLVDIFKADDEIVKIKYFDKFIYVLDASGLLTKLDEKNMIYQYKLLNELSSNFNISDIEIYDILDIEKIDDNLLISTRNNAVYSLNEKDMNISAVILEPGIKLIRYLKDGLVFCASDSECTIFKLSSGKKIEKYFNLKNSYQLPEFIRKDGKDLVVIGKPVGLNATNLLHYWKEDISNTSYNNKDNKVSPYDFRDIAIKCIKLEKSYLYIVGVRPNGNLVIIEYSLMFIHRQPTKLEFDVIDFSRMTGFDIIGDGFIVSLEDELYSIKDNDIVYRFKFSKNIKKLHVFNGEIYAISGNDLINIDIPDFKIQAGEVEFKINLGEICNNIDIFVSGAKSENKITLYDAAHNQLKPSYYAVYKNNSILKLSGSMTDIIYMKIQVSQTSEISGFSLKKNKIFLR